MNENMEGNTKVVELTDNPEMARPVIEKRLRYAESLTGIKEGQGINLDDSAYSAIEKITSGNVGLTLELVQFVINKVQEERPQMPCNITGADVESLGVTRQELEDWWDDPTRGAKTIRLG